MNTQFKKGVLELCVLSLLARHDCYGYDISETLSKSIGIADGTVYPILRKLKAEGLVTAYLSEQSGGPPRKYYSLTEAGKTEFQTAKAQWLDFAQGVQKVLQEDISHG